MNNLTCFNGCDQNNAACILAKTFTDAIRDYNFQTAYDIYHSSCGVMCSDITYGNENELYHFLVWCANEDVLAEMTEFIMKMSNGNENELYHFLVWCANEDVLAEMIEFIMKMSNGKVTEIMALTIKEEELSGEMIGYICNFIDEESDRDGQQYITKLITLLPDDLLPDEEITNSLSELNCLSQDFLMKLNLDNMGNLTAWEMIKRSCWGDWEYDYESGDERIMNKFLKACWGGKFPFTELDDCELMIPFNIGTFDACEFSKDFVEYMTHEADVNEWFNYIIENDDVTDWNDWTMIKNVIAKIGDVFFYKLIDHICVRFEDAYENEIDLEFILNYMTNVGFKLDDYKKAYVSFYSIDSFISNLEGNTRSIVNGLQAVGFKTDQSVVVEVREVEKIVYKPIEKIVYRDIERMTYVDRDVEVEKVVNAPINYNLEIAKGIITLATGFMAGKKL